MCTFRVEDKVYLLFRVIENKMYKCVLADVMSEG